MELFNNMHPNYEKENVWKNKKKNKAEFKQQYLQLPLLTNKKISFPIRKRNENSVFVGILHNLLFWKN